MDLVLIRVQADGSAKAATIGRRRTVIGRQTGCQLRIRAGEVSREHCEVISDEGTASVRDLGSRNGTYVNGVRVEEKRLEAGDLLSIGPVVLLVQVDGQPREFDAGSLFREGQPGQESPAAPVSEPADQPVTDQSPTSGGLMEGLDGLSDANQDSSVVEFEFDFEDEEEEQRSQPPL